MPIIYTVIILVFSFSPIFAFADPHILRLATTTSTKASGLSDILIPRFEKETGFKVETSIVGTGTALRMGRSGQVDVILVHAPDEEARFVKDGYGVKRNRVMYNDFILLGPADDLANVRHTQKIEECFNKIAASKQLFVSRADDSGTHKKELKIWEKSGIDPYGQDWYYEVGAGMRESLKQASQKKAYTIADRGSWLALKNTLSLKLLNEGDELLQNPYSVIAINSEKISGINKAAADAFIKWILSTNTKKIIGDFRIMDQQLFTPYD